METKLVIYQVFTRLFGNTKNANIRGGTLTQNGCGRMSAFSDHALKEIRRMGATHVWFTGLLQHASQTAWPEAGIAADHPATVKGLAGSPYAIRDYYNVDPDLADKPQERLAEADNLFSRAHNAGLKVIIDFVPNHVARNYHSTAKPFGVDDLGEKDRHGTSFDPNNNFYYLPGQIFTSPADQEGADSCYYEFPARATGNNCFTASPAITDWYETVKLNYGIDFLGGRNCFDPIPDTWYKMRHILLYWAARHVDGFRCDMAEMIPVEFWRWVIPAVKEAFPNVVFIAEVYDPQRYSTYFHEGKFDFLYDKVGLYDTLRGVVCGYRSAHGVTHCWQSLGELQPRMLNFLENHDEQRIASPFFANDPQKARPAFVVAAAMNVNPVMVYAGQELGERGMDSEGFSGEDGRTTIFDYWSVDSLRRWYNDGRLDESLLTDAERSLRHFYIRVMNLCRSSAAIREGKFFDLMYLNPAGENFNPDRQFAWMRCAGDELLLIVSNFADNDAELSIFIPENAFDYFNLPSTVVFSSATDLLTDEPMPYELKRNTAYQLRVGRNNARIVRFII